MNKNLALLGFVLVFLMQSPGAFAIDCSGISEQNYQICDNILNSNLSMEEKEALILNLEYYNKNYPDHNYIFLRNTLIEINEAPENVTSYQSEFIKDAWLKIFTAMPSVIYNDSLLCPKQIKILSGFNHRLEIPSNYQSNGYPEINQGDCRRDYFLLNNFSENKVSVDGIYQGSGKLVDAFIEEDSTILAEYNVGADIQIEYYQWNRYCCEYRNGRCRRYCNSCDFSNKEVKEDRLTISDYLPVKLYSNNLTASLKVVDTFNSNTEIETNFSNSVEIIFNESYYKFYDKYFEINYSHKPYYIATLKATDYSQEKLFNLFKDGNNIIVKNTEGCRIHAFDLFNILDSNCDLSYEDFSFTIETDEFYYKTNESIKVKIIPNNILANISYGNQSAFGHEAIFNAELGINKISTIYEGKTAEKFIFVYEESKFVLLWKLIVFFTLVLLFYLFLRKLARKAS